MPKDWVESVREERDEIGARFDRLRTFMQTKKYQKLPEVQRVLLSVQYDVMLTYLHILTLRLDHTRENKRGDD